MDPQIKLRRDVEEFGWHILNVFSTNEHPPLSYSVGLYRTFKHPEIVIVGLPGQTAQALINGIGAEIKKGRRFPPGSRSSDFLNGYEATFVDVAEALYGDYFGQAIDYYGSRSFPVVQFVWPDRAHHFPWDDGFDSSLRATQPILSTSPEQSFN